MYIVIETQTNGEQTGVLTFPYSSKNEAESKYHSVLAAAAVSNVGIHAAVLITDQGYPLMHDCYIHVRDEEE